MCLSVCFFCLFVRVCLLTVCFRYVGLFTVACVRVVRCSVLFVCACLCECLFDCLFVVVYLLACVFACWLCVHLCV